MSLLSDVSITTLISDLSDSISSEILIVLGIIVGIFGLKFVIEIAMLQTRFWGGSIKDTVSNYRYRNER